jgi:hypothetical protein
MFLKVSLHDNTSDCMPQYVCRVVISIFGDCTLRDLRVIIGENSC